MKRLILLFLILFVSACEVSVNINSSEFSKIGDCIIERHVKDSVPSWVQDNRIYKVVNREIADKHMWYQVVRWNSAKHAWREDAETLVVTVFKTYQKVPCPH